MDLTFFAYPSLNKRVRILQIDIHKFYKQLNSFKKIKSIKKNVKFNKNLIDTFLCVASEGFYFIFFSFKLTYCIFQYQ